MLSSHAWADTKLVLHIALITVISLCSKKLPLVLVAVPPWGPMFGGPKDREFTFFCVLGCWKWAFPYLTRLTCGVICWTVFQGFQSNFKKIQESMKNFRVIQGFYQGHLKSGFFQGFQGFQGSLATMKIVTDSIAKSSEERSKSM